jgi:hypothetical protein
MSLRMTKKAGQRTMNRPLGWPDDPVVEDVRKIRQAIWNEAGGTIEGLLKLLDREVPPKRVRKPRRPK